MPRKTEVQLPYQFEPRDYQRPFLIDMEWRKKRAFLCWHRRAGKDLLIWNWIIKKAFYHRVGIYYYLYPTSVQGRKSLWDNMDAAGRRFLDYIPAAIIDGDPNQTEMKIRFKNGSIIQVIGTDNYDSIRGSNPVGCVFSEFAWHDPRAWDTVRPILNENGGWAVFNTTPAGRNHAYDLWKIAVNSPDWHTSILTVDNTRRADGSPVVTQGIIDEERRLGMDEEMINQEYFCSWVGVQRGSYYGAYLEDAERDGRIGDILHLPTRKVDTWWDLGVNDATSIWFTQSEGDKVRVIDYLEDSGQGLPYYAGLLHDGHRKKYIYNSHNAPHDIEVKELGSGRSRIETARDLGIRFNVVKKLSIVDGIHAVRGLLPRLWFDKTRCVRGLDALRNYRKQWDPKRKCFQDNPYHDWASNGADAARYMAIGIRINQGENLTKRDAYGDVRTWATPEESEGSWAT